MVKIAKCLSFESSLNLQFFFIVVPEQLIIQLLRERLGQLDCVSRGWVLHGFPKNREQADSLERAGFVPNR